ncbi:hypothetical protein ACPA9J_12625 [Pseudomonas aeruginosa]
MSRLASSASDWPVDVLYFADSTGSMKPADVCETVAWLREGWSGALGFHAHDNMGLALQNTLTARTEGVEMVGCHHHRNGTRPRQCAHRGTVDRACRAAGQPGPPCWP